LKFLKEHCPEHYAFLAGKFKKGLLYAFFHSTPTDKPGASGVSGNSGSKIAPKAAKNGKVGNFKDLHKLDRKNKE